MSRCMLHKSKLEEFKDWLTSNNYAHRPGRGDWQVLQVCKDGKNWNSVYERAHMPEHFTTDRHLDSLVSRFCKERSNG